MCLPTIGFVEGAAHDFLCLPLSGELGVGVDPELGQEAVDRPIWRQIGKKRFALKLAVILRHVPVLSSSVVDWMLLYQMTGPT